MRKTLLVAAILAACAKSETPADTTPAPAPPLPPALSAADIAGTWHGTSRIAGSDSVTAKWTVTTTSDSTGTLTYEGSATSIAFASHISGDSVMIASEPFTQPGAKKGAPKVIFSSVGRVQDGKFIGTSIVSLADNTDSVVSVRTFEATRTP